MPVGKRRFYDIRIDILTLLGAPINFTSARRPQKSFYIFDAIPHGDICKYQRRRLPHTFIMKDQLVQYYLRTACRESNNGIQTNYSDPPFFNADMEYTEVSYELYSVWLDPSFGEASNMWDERRYIHAVKF
jgi:hypothetical protein